MPVHEVSAAIATLHRRQTQRVSLGGGLGPSWFWVLVVVSVVEGLDHQQPSLADVVGIDHRRDLPSPHPPPALQYLPHHHLLPPRSVCQLQRSIASKRVYPLRLISSLQCGKPFRCSPHVTDAGYLLPFVLFNRLNPKILLPLSITISVTQSVVNQQLHWAA